MKLKDRWKEENSDFVKGVKIISNPKPKKVVKAKVKKNG